MHELKTLDRLNTITNSITSVIELNKLRNSRRNIVVLRGVLNELIKFKRYVEVSSVNEEHLSKTRLLQH